MLYYTDYQYIANTYEKKNNACVEYPHGLAWFLCFPNVIKVLLHGSILIYHVLSAL